jgi:hypothetical protein
MPNLKPIYLLDDSTPPQTDNNQAQTDTVALLGNIFESLLTVESKQEALHLIRLGRLHADMALADLRGVAHV